MNRFRSYYIVFAVTALLSMLPFGESFAEVGVADLSGEDRMKFERFRELFQYGSPDEFFAYAAEYEQDLKAKGYMMLYYKLQNNKGFFALRHNMVYRAMQIAEHLDDELREAEAKEYYYLATGLLGDVYTANHNRLKAEQLFMQALEEVGDNDPKFTMRCYQSLAENQSLADPDKALDWINKSLALAEDTKNTEYLSLSLAIGAYIQFLNNKRDGFYRFYDQYQAMREKKDPNFSYRYDNVVEIARLSFEGDYDKATYQLGHSGTIYVDSSLVAIHIFGMERNIEKIYGAMKRHYLEIDSVYCMFQEANYDQMATERILMRSREEAKANKMLVKRLIIWMIALTVIFLIVYVMGRRRLVRKIWAQLQ
ncbi:MAG: tetratricopeptide repeat protein [Prevotella sp.]|nr:tetratricopeptide repeat protein [Prevotella sp.]